jgi:hypothetical protein
VLCGEKRPLGAARILMGRTVPSSRTLLDSALSVCLSEHSDTTYQFQSITLCVSATATAINSTTAPSSPDLLRCCAALRLSCGCVVTAFRAAPRIHDTPTLRSQAISTLSFVKHIETLVCPSTTKRTNQPAAPASPSFPFAENRESPTASRQTTRPEPDLAVSASH